MILSAFSTLGLFELSGREPDARAIYAQTIEGFDGTSNGGKSYDTSVGTRMEAIAFVMAMAAGRLSLRARQAAEQAQPSKAVELLPLMEAQHGIVPGPTDRMSVRRAAVAQRARLPAGAGREAIESDLISILGSDLIAYHTQTIGTGAVYPTNLGDAPMTLKLPSTSRKIVALADSVPFVGVPLTVRYRIPVLRVNGIEDPSNELDVGDVVVFEVGALGQMDRVTVTDKGISGGIRTITTTFTRPHSNGVFGYTQPIPYWISTQRHSTVAVTAAAANDPEKRRKVNEYMARALRASSTWAVVEAVPGATVRFALGSASLSRRALVSIPI
jgi:hypothetical protein